MIEVSSLDPPVVRLLSVAAIAEVSPAGPGTTRIRMLDGREHIVSMSYETVRQRLTLALVPVVLLDE